MHYESQVNEHCINESSKSLKILYMPDSHLTSLHWALLQYTPTQPPCQKEQKLLQCFCFIGSLMISIHLNILCTSLQIFLVYFNVQPANITKVWTINNIIQYNIYINEKKSNILTVKLTKPWTPEIFMECYCVARNKPIRRKITKPQTATVISLWFRGLLTCPELYCDWPVHNQHSWNFSGVHGFLSLTVKH